jgi:hypothetical protein
MKSLSLIMLLILFSCLSFGAIYQDYQEWKDTEPNNIYYYSSKNYNFDNYILLGEGYITIVTEPNEIRIVGSDLHYFMEAMNQISGTFPSNKTLQELLLDEYKVYEGFSKEERDAFFIDGIMTRLQIITGESIHCEINEKQ